MAPPAIVVKAQRADTDIGMRRGFQATGVAKRDVPPRPRLSTKLPRAAIRRLTPPAISWRPCGPGWAVV